jgi:pSer/pThr/pTyr-binding forkhead associated (FHA) protein
VSFVLQRVTARGLVLNQVSGDVLRIGRGTNADLRSDNPAVSLEHAVIQTDPAGFAITDKGSITGTYVNRKPVESARLSKGDVIEIGDLRVEVQLAETARPLFLRVVQTAARKAGMAEEEEEEALAAPVAGGGVLKAPSKIDYADAFRLRRPYFTKLSLVALLTIAALAVVAEVIRPERQAIFMPGGVSSAHARGGDNGKSVAKDCRACHEPWRGVVDRRCVACHARAPHAVTEAAPPACISCHPEHRDAPKLAQMDDVKCVGCHAALQAHVKPGVNVRDAIAHVAVFGDRHPDFSFPNDPDTLRFNHKLHLRPDGIFNGEGKREVLQCTTCHKLVTAGDANDPKPVTFAADCQRCHKLTFDRRFPNDEAPHGGDPGVVYGFVIGMYSGNRELAGKSPEEIRRILTTRPPQNDDRSAIYAEQVVKTKCALCHDIQRAGSRLAVKPPILQTLWLRSVPFHHGGKHATVRCEDCHEGARTSANTQDVLMSSRKDCVACHGAGGKSATTCVTCHRYHERSKSLPAKMVKAGLLPTGGDGAEMLGTILLAAIVILLLVLLVPVGMAVYQRLRVKPDDRITEKRPAVEPTMKMAAIKMPPPPPVPAAPSAELRAGSAGAATPPPPPVTPEPVPRGTVVAPLVHDRSTEDRAAAPQATELVQWYGMLLCTAGPLEGQRFIVEENGVYIGRDATLSQIVVADSRVSKRHVRIVPRDGKVHAIDQGSTNGTFLGSAGGQRITEVQLKRGDTIVLADNAAAFLYQI